MRKNFFLIASIVGWLGLLVHCSSSSPSNANDVKPDGGGEDRTTPSSETGGRDGTTDGTKSDVGTSDGTAADGTKIDEAGHEASTCGDPGQPCCAAMMCNAPTSCISKVCTCPSGSTPCGAACVDEQTDNSNCGGCGLTCSTTCTAGECIVTLATGQNGPTFLAIDDTNVYWANLKSIRSVPKAGGKVSTLADRDGEINAMAVESGNVYLLGATSFVLSVPTTGGSVVTLVNQGTPAKLAVNATDVYWTDESAGKVLKCALAGCGGSPTTLASGQNLPVGIDIDSTNVYWGNTGGGGLFKAPLAGLPDGGTATKISNGVSPFSLRVNATTAYSFSGLGIESVPLAGGPVTVIASSTEPNALAIDSTNVYWGTQWGAGPGYVDAVTSESFAEIADGGVTLTLAASQGQVEGIAVDDTSVYWADYVSGTILKITPK